MVTVEWQALSRVNSACAQNDVAVVTRLALRNDTDDPLVGVRVTLRAIPPVLLERIWVLDRIGPQSAHEVSDTKADLDVARLAGMNEAELGELELRVEADGLEPLIEHKRIDLLARDEWGGLSDMAQVLAAFVSPNEPAVAKLLKDAARLLEAAGHDGSIDGYQSGDPRRAYMLTAAIWSAATGLRLNYAEPPASFEEEGQKVRGPIRITEEGLATCLDATLLLAAAFEAAGLNSVVLFSQGHAWVGVWIQKMDLGHVTERDVVAVRKAVQAHELVPVETTLLTKRPTVGFAHAEDEGRHRLAEDRESEFVMAVDIARSRAAGIRPQASHGTAPVGENVATEEIVPAVLPPSPDFGRLPGEASDEEPETPQGRIERWQRKLLDLSLRNRLLNFRDSKQTVPFRCPDVASLEDALADGKKFRALSLSDENPIGNRTVSRAEVRRIEEQVAQEAFERGQIAVPLTGQEMSKRLLTLFRRANSDLQEGGTNTLFLAAGFLRWKKTEGDTRVYRAPLLLIPVKLERRSAQSPFRIAHHEDEVRINFTLLEFLKRDFSIRIPELEVDLPRDDSGIDVGRILEVVRRKVRDAKSFEVVEDVALSTFSFSKYLMWKDLVDRADRLRENRLVRHLIDGPEEESPEWGGVGSVSAAELDRRHPPGTLYTPLPADSSQLAAVIAAARGMDFVLVGPPGTGKSQTIANMVAQCLAEGRTVLFVAEKAAALDVVHRRLVATGLGDAVLELHSNKTDRKSVIRQLGRGWDRAAEGVESEWIAVTDELQFSRDQLNDYVQALHAKGSHGFSVFEAVGRAVRGDAPFELSFPSKDAHDVASYRRLVSLAAETARVHAIASQGPPLSLVGNSEWSFQWQNAILGTAQDVRSSLGKLREAERALSSALGLGVDDPLSAQRRARLKALAPRLAEDAVDLSSVPDLPAQRLAALAAAFAEDMDALVAAKSEAVASYPLETVRRMPVASLDADWRDAQTKLWPMSLLARRKVRKLLGTYADHGQTDPAVDLPALLAMQERDAALRHSPLAEVGTVGEAWDADGVEQTIKQAIAFRDALESLRPEVEDSARYATASDDLFTDLENRSRDLLRRYLAAEAEAKTKRHAFVMHGGMPLPEASVAELEAGLATVAAEHARLADWVKWTETRNRAVAAGLAPLVQALDDGCLEGPVEEAFEKAYAAWWLPLAMDASPKLRRFAHWEHERVIEAFRELDDKAAALAPTEVMRRIAHGLPARDGVRRKSELGVLRHQLNLKRPSMPIRRLLENLPETLGKLAPCVLMSPLSVAQYLPAGRAAFDVVIFDEASQITTWDAIGAIARGRQTIVVGDPKQLPPTNFFGRAEDEDEDLPETERDMPSILDEVAAAGVPERRLDWHYRSRDEALVAFSNRFYYGGRLVTFPAPTTGTGALRFHKVDGIYARGHGGRTNQKEAEAVSEMVHRRLRSWVRVPEQDRLTLGVITFNSEQQSLILDQLDAMRRTHSDLEWFFSDDREEPVIVKNLENIQGDERDVMLFSVTFGPDVAGKLTMNFGPLNNSGGEKRLNVAVTRARRELHIFSSIMADEIDLGRTRAEGVRDMKAFLDYAERGSVALPARDEGALGPAENAFEDAVGEAFRAKGWEVRTQVGVSGFRIDLGVVHPDRAGSYLCGIECDGARYHSSATARDRDKVRQAVLEGLGWTIIRVWSTDWFRNAHAVVERVHAQLEELLDVDREARASEEAEMRSESETRDVDDGLALVDERTLLETVEQLKETPTTEQPVERSPAGVGEPPSASSLAHRFADRTPEILDGAGHVPKPLVLEPDYSPDPDRFFEAGYSSTLRSLIRRVVEAEGPLTLLGLARRVALEHGWQRTGKRIQERVHRNLGAVECHGEFDTMFVWAPGTYAQRVPFRGLEARSIRDVSRAEIASVIDDHAGDLAEAEDPILALSRLLDISRLSKGARAYLEECVRWREQD